jgi:hypothetical protein
MQTLHKRIFELLAMCDTPILVIQMLTISRVYFMLMRKNSTTVHLALRMLPDGQVGHGVRNIHRNLPQH